MGILWNTREESPMVVAQDEDEDDDVTHRALRVPPSVRRVGNLTNHSPIKKILLRDPQTGLDGKVESTFRGGSGTPPPRSHFLET